MLGGLGAWSVGTEIAGAVVAPGVVEVQSERQVIQHPDGGVVGEILARDGDSVTAGDVLLRSTGRSCGRSLRSWKANWPRSLRETRG
jgi:multidrug efflux pump subunit AcrA (membrane-fusion protein)